MKKARIKQNGKSKSDNALYLELKNVCFDAAIMAGRKLEEMFFKGVSFKEKQRGDYVTKADLASENIIINMIRKKLPKVPIISEEAGISSHPKKGEFFVMVDPLDGTNNFTYGFTDFALIISIAQDDEVLFCVDYLPIPKMLYWAEKGKGAFLGKRKIHVSKTGALGSATIGMGMVRYKPNTKKFMNAFKHGFFDFRKLKMVGSIGVFAAAIASGKIDGIVANWYEMHDSCPMAFLVKEAGGRVTDLKGRGVPIFSKGTEQIFSNGLLHSSLLRYVNKYAR